MKRFFVITIICFVFFCNIFSQTVNDIPLKDIDVDYIQIVGTTINLTGTKLAIEIDFGQQNKIFKNTALLKDASGNLVEFNSMIDALNFMCSNGYEFVQAYAVSVGDTGKVYHFLLRKNREKKYLTEPFNK